MKKIIKFVGGHKFWSIVIGLAVVYGGWRGIAAITNKGPQTTYTLGMAATTTIVATVSGTGQVANESQVNITPQVSAPVTSVLVQNGQSVKAGQVLVRLDATDQIKAVNSAQASLQNAQIALEKLQQPATTSSIAQAQYGLLQANQSVQNASTTLAKDYIGSYNSIVSLYNDLPSVVAGIGDVLYGSEVISGQANMYAYLSMTQPYTTGGLVFQQAAMNDYSAAIAAYNKSLADYQSMAVPPSNASVESMISESYMTAAAVQRAVTSIKNFMDFVNTTLKNQSGSGVVGSTYAKQLPAVFATQETNLQNYITTVTNDATALYNAQNTLVSDKNSITATEQNLTTQQASYEELLAGPNPLDIQSDQLAIEQAQNNLTDAQNTLADYTIRAPFDGVIAAVNVSTGDNASPGTAVATIITPQQYAEIPLNEVDAAKVKVGDKATLTFDALPNLTVAGHVTEMDTIGTVSQGVVTYNVQVTLDTQNSSIKPGMSVSANIITDVAQNVVGLPSAAVHTQGQTSYVLVVPKSIIASTLSDGSVTLNGAPETVQVTTGITDGTDIEIASGLQAGEEVVLRTSSAAAAVSAQTTSGARGGFGGGGILRIGG
ncbi:efflux RND transporter periplasmic adaptor subunit [Patescibacteria group bacterium]|nr:efflux RND transporter periplasmic adaptor subunit [Patescibacteria group bacterium]